VLLVGGLVVAFTDRPAGEPKTEQWMLETLPLEFGDYRASSSPENNLYTYKMDEVTYGTLDPYGIVARVYTSSETNEEYDAVVIASRSKDSFHDPRVCFSAQGWAIANQWVEMVDTESRGKVPVTLVLMDSADVRNRVAAFLYKGPGGFYGSTQRLKTAMLIEQFFGGQDLDGVFYRFIPLNLDPMDPDRTTKIKRFVAEFVDAANAASDGYF
jgi:hypothetical protein